MRFILILAALAVAVVVGLYIYGELLQPETQQIEQEALRTSDA